MFAPKKNAKKAFRLRDNSYWLNVLQLLWNESIFRVFINNFNQKKSERQMGLLSRRKLSRCLRLISTKIELCLRLFLAVLGVDDDEFAFFVFQVMQKYV